jgi:toxin HigB-1
MKMTKVVLTKQAQKDLTKLPQSIRESLAFWINKVVFEGLADVRKIGGYHDEPLKGDRKGQRSIRLNKIYRAIYILTESGEIELVTIIEVNKHNY